MGIGKNLSEPGILSGIDPIRTRVNILDTIRKMGNIPLCFHHQAYQPYNIHGIFSLVALFYMYVDPSLLDSLSSTNTGEIQLRSNSFLDYINCHIHIFFKVLICVFCGSAWAPYAILGHWKKEHSDIKIPKPYNMNVCSWAAHVTKRKNS